ncbi:restriction endonuclease subunit S [Anaerobacillus sp. 1_MG-2023]|uniref:restriction endonuclease subunit S n=1 Tax=Anaerobacillus sp. 1_MG-2023 TaxID=3062655 RepID=UPI0026E2537C|nr:restriction endonuclease subunit S [Anaerobacillus sp. 1_MG-2023]MDO6654509.1 restriction endonuclease subunit S [Anaerobacillus sp. 1_MG-2023]
MVTDVKDVRDGYKMTELGEIPVEWEVLTTGDLFENISNKGYPELPVLSVTQENGVVYRDSVGINIKYDKKSLKSYKLIDKGQFVISLRSFQGGIEYSNLKGISSPAYTVLSAKKKINNDFFRYFFKSFWFIERLKKSVVGIRDGKQISYSDFKVIKIPFPTLLQQQKIAETLCSVDETIETTDQLLEKTKELKKGLMQKLLTKGIGHTEFKKTELGEIPEEWEIETLSNVTDFITKGSTPTTYGFKWQESGVKFFKSDVVKEGEFVYGDFKFIDNEAHAHMARSKIIAGDLLITITGNIGRVAVVPKEIEEANINQHIAKITVINSGINPLFVYFWFNQEKIIRYYEQIKTGLAYPQISLKQVRETKIPIPSKDEQQRIVDILSSVDDQIKSYRIEKERLQELKKGLMQQLLTGKVRVSA